MKQVSQSGVYPILASMRQELRTKPSVVAGIKSDVTDGRVRVVEYHPGNGTRYTVVLSDLSNHLGADGETATLFWVQNYCHGWMVRPDPSSHAGLLVHYLDVQRHLKCSIFDAVILAELAGYLLGRPAITVEEFLREKNAV